MIKFINNKRYIQDRKMRSWRVLERGGKEKQRKEKGDKKKLKENREANNHLAPH